MKHLLFSFFYNFRGCFEKGKRNDQRECSLTSFKALFTTKFVEETLFLSFLLLLPMISMAQPPTTHYGCRHAKNLNHIPALTQAQKDLLNESNERSDTIDILNYNITLDVTNFNAARIEGACAIRFSPKVDEVDEMVLDLLNLEVDSVLQNSEHLPFTYDGDFVTVTFPQMNAIDTTEIVIYYGGQPTVASSGFGGFSFNNGIAYNLGIGLGENPYNYGRGWFPCFDNFVERSTYDLNVISSNGRKAYCVGTFLGEEDLGDGKIMRSFRMDMPLTTYLVGVAVSDYQEVNFIHPGAFGDVPVQLIANPGDLGSMQSNFEYLGDAIDELESWYGPYIWERVGYVLTPNGAMEHATNIAFPIFTATQGSTFDVNRLIAHELAHHWWGNVTTLSTPANMWIKEGNAEYGAHLFTEYAFGEDAFIKQVKDNLLLVLRQAHIEDDGFQPLSGIPYEHTYGMHTYNKGACIIHNMRAYLGDSLFREAQTAVLQDFAFQAVDAETYRDHLSLASGVDMTDYFEDLIFSPGFSNFEVEQVLTEPVGGQFEVNLTVQQKLRGAPHLHNNVPLEVTFFAEDWTEETISFYASGEFTSTTVTLDFEPQMTIVNRHQTLNMGRMNNLQIATEEGGLNTAYVDLVILDVTSITPGDSALVSIEHHWTAPDDTGGQVNLQISGTHFWSVQGIFPDDYGMRSTIRYQSGANSLDADLLVNGDDELVLLWRPTPDSEWELNQYYDKVSLGNSGFIRIDPFLPGDYALANDIGDVATTDIWEEAQILLSPNPAREKVDINIQLEDTAEDLQIRIFDTNGRQITERNFQNRSTLNTALDVTEWASGIYFLELNNGKKRKTVELVVE